jgi:hypothetical protein
MSDGIKKYKKIDVCKLNVSEKWCDSFLVTFPVSYRYNGDFYEGDEAYSGYDVVRHWMRSSTQRSSTL